MLNVTALVEDLVLPSLDQSIIEGDTSRPCLWYIGDKERLRSSDVQIAAYNQQFYGYHIQCRAKHRDANAQGFPD